MTKVAVIKVEGCMASSAAITHDVMARAMAYGTAVASFNVEEFGTERVERLTRDEIEARVSDLESYGVIPGA